MDDTRRSGRARKSVDYAKLCGDASDDDDFACQQPAKRVKELSTENRLKLPKEPEKLQKSRPSLSEKLLNRDIQAAIQLSKISVPEEKENVPEVITRPLSPVKLEVDLVSDKEDSSISSEGEDSDISSEGCSSESRSSSDSEFSSPKKKTKTISLKNSKKEDTSPTIKNIKSKTAKKPPEIIKPDVVKRTENVAKTESTENKTQKNIFENMKENSPKIELKSLKSPLETVDAKPPVRRENNSENVATLKTKEKDVNNDKGNPIKPALPVTPKCIPKPKTVPKQVSRTITPSDSHKLPPPLKLPSSGIRLGLSRKVSKPLHSAVKTQQ